MPTSPTIPSAQAEAARLDELRQVAIEERLEAQLALGEHTHGDDSLIWPHPGHL